MLCVPIIGPDREFIQTQMQAAADCGADLVEIRLDLIDSDIDDVDLGALIHNCKLPVIATCRSVDHGGKFRGVGNIRNERLQQACAGGASYIDIEYGESHDLPDVDAKILLSYHDCQETPDDLRGLCKAMAESRPAIIKIVTTAQSAEDNFKIFDLLLDPPTAIPLVAFCMGEFGKPSRILGRKFGSAMQFASLTAEFESAPGQVTAQDMIDVYRYRDITASTRVYGLIGRPVHHSISPHVFNAVFQREEMDAVYVPFLTDSFAALLDASTPSRFDIDGYSVTIPWKESAFQMLESNDKVLQKIGAINTLKRIDDLWIGTNTDYTAVKKIFGKILGDREGLRFALLGAGGMARSIAKAVTDRKGSLTIFHRDLGKAKLLSTQFDAVAQLITDIDLFEYDVVVNTTPVGMSPDIQNSPAPANIFHENMLAADMVYNPRVTRFLKEASDSGSATLPGRDIFVAQAALQFKYWTDREPPTQFMSDTADSILKALENIE